jgi:FMN phosphatase YigB (HAD superfamily)
MEALRKQPGACADLGRAQLELAARWLGTDAELILPVVKDWMERRPLALLRRCARRGTAEVLRRARESGCRLAVVSDYPAEEKLRALGIRSFFNEVICAQDRDVQRLKPDPRGIELALLRLGVSRWEAIYVGDRPDLDAAAAASAGVACAIIGRSERMTRCNYLPISHLYELAEARP